MSGDSYLWIGSLSGNWQAASNWEDLTSGADPATIAPGSLDSVTFNSAGNLVQVISGNGEAASLMLNGNNLIIGKVDAGILAGDGTLGISGGATLSAASGALEGGFDVQGMGALAKIAGDFAWGFGGLDAAAGGDIRIGGTLSTNGHLTYLEVQSGGTISAAELMLTGNSDYVSVASGGIFQIGHGAAVAGEVVIEAGATFAQQDGTTDYIQSDVLDNGTMVSESSVYCASIAGTGTLIGTAGADLNLGNVSGLHAITLDNGIASISSAITASHINIVQGSLESDVINAASSGTGITLSGGSALTVLGSVGVGVRIAMQGAGDILALGRSGETTLSFGGTLSGFTGNDTIEIDSVPISTVNYTAGKHGAAGIIDLFDNGVQDGSIAIIGPFKGEAFLPVTLANGETEIVLKAATPKLLTHDNSNPPANSRDDNYIVGRSVGLGRDGGIAFIHAAGIAALSSKAEFAFQDGKISQYGVQNQERLSLTPPFENSIAITSNLYNSCDVSWTSTPRSSQPSFGNQFTEPKLGVYCASGGLLSNLGIFS